MDHDHHIYWATTTWFTSSFTVITPSSGPRHRDTSTRGLPGSPFEERKSAICRGVFEHPNPHFLIKIITNSKKKATVLTN